MRRERLCENAACEERFETQEHIFIRPAKKLNFQKVRQIRRMHTLGYTNADLGRRFGVHRSTIAQIVNNYIWTTSR